MLFLNLLLLLVGFFALIKGADRFVDGSSSLAKNFKVPGLIIGLTIVALGTSAPELAVSISAAVQGSNEIALSNVVGSNIFNLLCVLGVCAVIHAVPVDKGIIRRDFPLSIGATLLLLLMTSSQTICSGKIFQLGMDDTAGTINRLTGLILLTIFLIYIFYLIYDAKRHPEDEKPDQCLPVWKCLLFIVIGLALTVAGGQAVVYSAKAIAGAMGMSETLIGLTIVAVGTSLPELVTSVVAARKGENGLAMGNVVGSSIFNLLFILGISSAIHPIAINTASVYDMVILMVINIIAYIFSLSRESVRRPEGVVMVLLYLLDVLFAIVR